MSERKRRSTVAEAHLENWYIVRCFGRKRQVVGKIYEDGKGRFKDGTMVRTSDIRHLDKATGMLWTQNTTYSLGEERKP